MKIELLNLDNVKQAFAVANNAIYFADRSDYKSALYEVCKTLNPKIDDELIGSKYIEEDIQEHKEQSKTYEYLVIYEMPNIRGRCKVDRTKLLDNFTELEELEKYLRKSNAVTPGISNDIKSKLLVMDFKLLRTID
ncbi:hypothetical protein [Romboutsia lituseburensis]|uniref:Uncharacterized protein n=1 Tax=Romboutsia lituseburensis DSM 797 TaxID=1121325 RepID=A0A1G9U205_9FIRM|nr:hypothetical protein [Romboutsia lituseburensis]CEH34739.1 Hypothetical protein RLITU_2156 [Romboutsia lituseburensis]SDM53694.1 hypothetical protein SAMN04515677_11448 [Romboutsia lituseburensis DSM 797]